MTKSNKMRILGIETTGPYCSAAFLEGEEIFERRGREKLSHLQSITLMIDELMTEAGIDLQDLDHIAVSTGPGSYTGIRIGVATGRALAQAAGVSLIAVPTLFAFGISEYEANKDGICCPILNARRGQIYGGAYRDFCEIIPAGPYMLDEFIDILREGALEHSGMPLKFIGDGVTAYREQVEELCSGMVLELSERTQQAGDVCEMAMDMLNYADAFGASIGLKPDELTANYMRMAEAEKNLREGRLFTKNSRAKKEK